MPARQVAGIIELRGLRVLVSLGLLPEERSRRQPVEIDIDVHVDLTAAAISDDLGDAVDYGALADAVVTAATAAHVDLLERLVVVLADAALAVDGRIAAVELVLRKLRPPVPHDLASAAVRTLIHRDE